ncbi:MAG: N-acetylmuramoyl-L-alanine amidase [Clostridia bacterium]|nr:N-acetylmuramoyl-L-alanine amidase [Clostridia bacterium]
MVFKKKYIIIALAFLLAASTVLVLSTTSASIPNKSYTIVIDPGHGGIDGGSVGVSGQDENYLNLEYSLCLKEILTDAGVNVIMTRTNLNGLYSIFSDNKKLDDMKKRKDIVTKSKADMVLSIHMNSFPLKSARGAQVFYKKDSVSGEKLAENIQEVFIKTLPNAKPEPAVGDYYMLNEFEIPSVIIECGYISNEEEEQLILQEDYKKLVCLSIFAGVLKFLAL